MKCIICNAEAQYVIKGTKNAYCKQHAEECFGDISYLSTIEQEEKRLSQLDAADQLSEIE